MKNIINILLLTILTSSYLLSTQIEDEANTSSTLELAIEQDSLALVALYNSTDGNNWTISTNWLSDSLLSTWYGITLDDNGRVIKIELDDNNLVGEIPVELGGISNLVVINFWNNELTGGIPKELGSLSKLRDLQLSNNRLEGIIPVELGNLTNLTSLSLGINKLTGTIPNELGKLIKLRSLSLQRNNLSGTIPSELGNLFELFLLFLSNNQLTGNIPKEIGTLYDVFQLSLNNNKLTGSIPKEIGNLRKLNELNLGQNNLSGTVPPEIRGLENISTLELNNNNLSGSIPIELTELEQLYHLNLSSNNFSGSIPIEIGDFKNLSELYLGGNNLSGSIPSEIGNLKNLRNLYLNFNELSGAIPESFLNLTNLQKFSIWNNEIDSGLENIPSYPISEVYLQDNKFDFADFNKANINAETYEYAPQDSLGEKEIVILEEGEQYTLSSLNEHAEGNMYIWYKDGEEMPNETSHDLVISDAQKGDEGIYTCSITNEVAPLLTLYRRPITATFDKTASVNPYVKITDEFKIFPNPAINHVTIEFNNSQSKGRIQILDLLGSEVMNLDFNNQNRINIDVSQFANGYYNIVMKTEDKKYFQPLFVNR